MKRLVQTLGRLNKTISSMESCTGGAFINSLTNIEGASEVTKFSAVTYSNEYKIKMGVSKSIIDKYTVYSIETAMEMSKSISHFADSDYGVGITGKLNKADKYNPHGSDNMVYISIFDRSNNKYYGYNIKVKQSTREENKEYIVKTIVEKMLEILDK